MLGVSFINKKIENLSEHSVDEPELSAADDQDEEFFATKKKASNDISDLRSFLDSLSNYARRPLLWKVFIELNTPLPASAACERLFSVGGLIFRPHRSSRTWILVKCNKELAWTLINDSESYSL